MSPTLPPAHAWHVDIDAYLRPLIPRNRLYLVPRPLSRFLGYRDGPRNHDAPPGNLIVALWSMLGAFCGICVLSGLFMSEWITSRGGPVIIGSFGAAAILEYGAIESPFSQPRNAILGQLLSALVGVAVTKLFALAPNFAELSWLAGALAVALSSGLMTVTKTIHPPAGATALLAATTPDITRLGWMYLPIVLVSAVLTLAVACLLNNIQRQFPVYWWTPDSVAPKAPAADEEKTAVDDTSIAPPAEPQQSGSVVVGPDHIYTPPGFHLSVQERAMLAVLQERMQQAKGTRSSSWSESDEGGRSSSKKRDSQDRSSSEQSHSGA